jgi:2-polyprenyl-3-methyl-5-hydroxy-6-metoxy-1,4-benzoquinol methylase
MDADLPYGYFDGVFVSNFLEHLPDQNAVGATLGELHAAMEPGGRIVISRLLPPTSRSTTGTESTTQPPG